MFQKLINQSERFHFKTSNAIPQRSKQVFDLLPQLTASFEYTPGLAYKTIRRYNIVNTHPNWYDNAEKDFLLAANDHLESGKRIEEFLPDLATSFQLNYVTKTSVDIPEGPKIGIYASCYSVGRAWGFWSEREWFDLIQKIHLEKPEIVFYIIGASFDTDLGDKLISLLALNKIPHVSTLGKPLGYVVELLRVLDYFIGFPSGLPIMNETLGKDTFMFYPLHLDKMRYAWADEKRIASKQYMAELFCEPFEAYLAITKEYNLFDKI